MTTLHLLTGSQNKLQAARRVFLSYGISIKSLNLDIPEIQASTSAEIARYAVEQAYKITKQPVVREDHSFYIKELNFPGPFMTYADKAITPKQLLKILNTLDSRDAYFELSAAYADPHGQIHEFSYQVPIIMSTKIRGSDRYRWEKLMMFPGSGRTLAEADPTDRQEVWTKNYHAVAKLITGGLNANQR